MSEHKVSNLTVSIMMLRHCLWFGFLLCFNLYLYQYFLPSIERLENETIPSQCHIRFVLGFSKMLVLLLIIKKGRF